MANAVGEEAQRKGEDGARRAKRWLDATTRVTKSWTNEDAVHASRLSFTWPHGGQPFSFDMGGLLKGEPFDGHFFMAEVKNYYAALDQGTLYDDWLAKCYVVRKQQPVLADHFMWITWAPFRIGDWPDLMTADIVRKALRGKANKKRVFNAEPDDDIDSVIDESLVAEVVDRLWLIVLSEKQERLVISAEHRSWITMRETQENG